MPKKKKPNGAGEVRQRANGKWEGRYTVGYDSSGKRIRKSVYANSFKECNDKMNEILTALANNCYIEKNELTLIVWLREWLSTYCQNNIRSSTYCNYETYINRHFEPYFGDLKLQKLTPERLQRYINYKQEGGRLDNKPGGISSKTIVNMRNMLNAALKQAEINGLVSKNVAPLTRVPKQVKPEMRMLSEREFTALILAAQEDRDGAPIILALYTGMRIGEVMALKYSDIELVGEAPAVHVRASIKREYLNDSHDKAAEVISMGKGKTALVRGATKTKTSKRSIPLFPEAIVLLQKQLDMIQHEKIQAGSAYMDYGFLFCNSQGYPYDQRTYQDKFNKIIQKAEIEKTVWIGTDRASVGFHTLRHTFASRAIRAGMDILVLSKILGHAQASTTMNQYGHVLPNYKRESMEMYRQMLLKSMD